MKFMILDITPMDLLYYSHLKVLFFSMRLNFGYKNNKFQCTD